MAPIVCHGTRASDNNFIKNIASCTQYYKYSTCSEQTNEHMMHDGTRNRQHSTRNFRWARMMIGARNVNEYIYSREGSYCFRLVCVCQTRWMPYAKNHTQIMFVSKDKMIKTALWKSGESIRWADKRGSRTRNMCNCLMINSLRLPHSAFCSSKKKTTYAEQSKQMMCLEIICEWAALHENVSIETVLSTDLNACASNMPRRSLVAAVPRATNSRVPFRVIRNVSKWGKTHTKYVESRIWN